MTVAPPRDRAVFAIVFSNLLAVAGVWIGDGGLLMLLWPYFVQSLVIGFFARRRVVALKRFSVEGLEGEGPPPVATPEFARGTGNALGCVYAFFHMGYALFLTAFTVAGLKTGYLSGTDSSGQPMTFHVGQVTLLDVAWLIFVGASFALTHRASHREHLAADLRGMPNLGQVATLPFFRIIPMHLTIILAFWLGGTGGLLLFGGLKTVVDVAMHRIEHAMLQQPQPAPQS